MKSFRFAVCIVLLMCLLSDSFAQTNKKSYLVAHRDTCDLYLDVYPPAPGSETVYDGQEKPTVLFVFGGGFVVGQRDDPYLMPWFKILTDNGYRVVSVDYRLGLKGVEMKFDLFHLISSAKKTKRAVDIGVEDVFESVRFICLNAAELDIDPNNIVISGSSAGAMITLSCVLETCSPTERTALLPPGFRFKGAISFAGAIMSDSGVPSYAVAPPPQLLFHGTADGAVNYDKTSFGRWGMYGSSALVERVFAKKGYVYSIYRYVNHSHDMAANLVPTWPVQKSFLEQCVISDKPLVMDVTLDDPDMPVLESITLGDIYK